MRLLPLKSCFSLGRGNVKELLSYLTHFHKQNKVFQAVKEERSKVVGEPPRSRGRTGGQSGGGGAWRVEGIVPFATKHKDLCLASKGPGWRLACVFVVCRPGDRLSRRIIALLCDVPPGAEWRKVQCPELDRLPELLLCPGGRGF